MMEQKEYKAGATRQNEKKAENFIKENCNANSVNYIIAI